MQTSASSSTMKLTTDTKTLPNLTATKQPESTSTKSSKMSRVTNPLKRASKKFDQKLDKLKARVSKHKMAPQECEKTATTLPPQAADESRDEGKQAIDREVNCPINIKTVKREARRAKWAARRASFKQFAKKSGKAVAVSVTVMLGFIPDPVLIAMHFTATVIGIVLRLVMNLVGFIWVLFLVFSAW